MVRLCRSARELPLVDHAALAREAVASRVARSRPERQLLLLGHMKMLSVLVCSMFACVAPSSDDPAVETDAGVGVVAGDSGASPEPHPVPLHWNGGEWDPRHEIFYNEGKASGGGTGPWWGNGPGTANPTQGDGGGGVVSGGSGAFDPEPDKNKDRKSCFDWCDWSKRQCFKECKHRYPNPVRDFYKRIQCKRECDTGPDPEKGYDACQTDCRTKFPERPSVAAPLYDEGCR